MSRLEKCYTLAPMQLCSLRIASSFSFSCANFRISACKLSLASEYSSYSYRLMKLHDFCLNEICKFFLTCRILMLSSFLFTRHFSAAFLFFSLFISNFCFSAGHSRSAYKDYKYNHHRLMIGNELCIQFTLISCARKLSTLD